MIIKPCHDKVLIKEDKLTEQKVGNVLLPGNANAKNHTTGTVISVGTGRFQNGVNIPISVKAGDRVLYMKYAANCYRDEENSLTLVRDEEILGVVSDD